MWTKICGTTNLNDAQLAAELGANGIGFVFAESKRRVSAEQVAAITLRLPASVEKVGVFDRADAAWIVDTAEAAGLTAVQLHFALDGRLLQELQTRFQGRVKLIQVVSVPVDAADADISRVREAIKAALGRPELFAVLLDAAAGGRSGGLGQAFAWDRVASLITEAQESSGGPHLLLAGGLRPENVEAAVKALRPWGVDVVSGVEAAAGAKDPERLSHFLQITRAL